MATLGMKEEALQQITRPLVSLIIYQQALYVYQEVQVEKEQTMVTLLEHIATKPPVPRGSSLSIGLTSRGKCLQWGDKSNAST